MAEGPEFKSIRVLRVIPGSPASAAGLHDEDLLESIDGIPASQLDLDQVRHMFLRDRQTYAIKVRRKGEVLLITLKTANLLSTPAASWFAASAPGS